VHLRGEHFTTKESFSCSSVDVLTLAWGAPVSRQINNKKQVRSGAWSS